MEIQYNLDALYQEINDLPDTKQTEKIKETIDKLQNLLGETCFVCGEKQDDDGRCKCTNNNLLKN